MKKRFINNYNDFLNVGLDYLFYFKSGCTLEEIYDYFISYFDIRVYDHDTIGLLKNDVVVAYIHFHYKSNYFVIDISGYEYYLLYNVLKDNISSVIYYYK